MSKYILVTSGVCSSLGKGVASSTIGSLLECSGLKIAMMKCDPYINVDAGNISPFQHGEVYVTEDGAETESTLNFPKGNIPRFRVNQQNKPEVNDIVIGKYGDESVYIDFLFEESTSPHFYKEFEKLFKKQNIKINLAELTATRAGKYED